MKKWIRFLPVLAWMGVIFWFSAQDGASSGRQSEMIVRLLAGVGIAGPNVELLLRKAAHMTEYAVLCALWALGRWLRKRRIRASCRKRT